MPPSSCSHTSFLLAPLNPIILFSSSLCLLANHQFRVLFSLDSFDQENRSAAAAGQCRPTRTAQNKKIGSLNVTMALRLVTSRVAASASSRSLAVAVRSTNGAFVWWKLSCVFFFLLHITCSVSRSTFGLCLLLRHFPLPHIINFPEFSVPMWHVKRQPRPLPPPRCLPSRYHASRTCSSRLHAYRPMPRPTSTPSPRRPRRSSSLPWSTLPARR